MTSFKENYVDKVDQLIAPLGMQFAPGTEASKVKGGEVVVRTALLILISPFLVIPLTIIAAGRKIRQHAVPKPPNIRPKDKEQISETDLLKLIEQHWDDEKKINSIYEEASTRDDVPLVLDTLADWLIGLHQQKLIELAKADQDSIGTTREYFEEELEFFLEVTSPFSLEKRLKILDRIETGLVRTSSSKADMIKQVRQTLEVGKAQSTADTLLTGQPSETKPTLDIEGATKLAASIQTTAKMKGTTAEEKEIIDDLATVQCPNIFNAFDSLEAFGDEIAAESYDSLTWLKDSGYLQQETNDAGKTLSKNPAWQTRLQANDALTFRIQASILGSKTVADRAEQIKKALKLVKYLVKVKGDYNGALIVWTAINSSAIQKLEKSWDHLETLGFLQKYRRRKEKYERLFDPSNQFQNLREKVAKRASKPSNHGKPIVSPLIVFHTLIEPAWEAADKSTVPAVLQDSIFKPLTRLATVDQTQDFPNLRRFAEQTPPPTARTLQAISLLRRNQAADQLQLSR